MSPQHYQCPGRLQGASIFLGYMHRMGVHPFPGHCFSLSLDIQFALELLFLIVGVCVTLDIEYAALISSNLIRDREENRKERKEDAIYNGLEQFMSANNI